MAPTFSSAIAGLRRLSCGERGGVSLLGALSLTAMIGMSGLAVEASQGYAEKVANQRIADAAALAAAMAYSASPGDPSVAATIANAAKAIGEANGVARADVEPRGPTPDGASRKLIAVTVTTRVTLRLTRVLTSALTYPISATGIAAVADGAGATDKGGSGCIIALSAAAPNGVLMSGGTALVGSDCVIASKGAITLSEGANITARQVIAGGAITRSDGTWIRTTPDQDRIYANNAGAAADPLADNAALKAALDKSLNPTAALTPATVANPDTPNGGKDWDFDWNGTSKTVRPFLVSGGSYVVPADSYRIRRMTIQGGVTVTFQGASTVTISDGFANGGNRVTVGDGSQWKVNGGFSTGDGGLAMGNSTLAIGQGTVFLNNFTIGNGDLSINAMPSFGWGTISIGAGRHRFRGLESSVSLTIGPGDFISAGKLSVKGGITVDIKAGETSAVIIGDTGGTSLAVEGGSTLRFGPSRTFGTTGGITTAGGTMLAIGAAANHLVDGTLNLAGSAALGPGAYTIHGDFINGTGGAITGSDVSFFLSGRVLLSGGAGLDLRAPAGAVGDALPDILFATRTNQATTISAGANMLLSGVWWTPNAPFVMSGGTSFRSGSRCFTLIADTLTLKEGGLISGTGCPTTAGKGGTGTPTVALVQ